MLRISLIVGMVLSISLSLSAAPPVYVLTDLGDLPGGSDHSIAYSINNYGQVVGSSRATPTSAEHPFLWTPDSVRGTSGTLFDLGLIDPTLHEIGEALGINDYGQVVATAGVPALDKHFCGNLILQMRLRAKYTAYRTRFLITEGALRRRSMRAAR